MSNPFVAEIRIFAGNFAPTGWASCDGQILPISQNTALFSLLGTQYGGDGKSNFALPNLAGSAPMHTTQFSGSSPFGDFFIGESGGEQTVTLLPTELPSHSHTLQARAVVANVATAGPTTSMSKPAPATNLAYQTAPGTQLVTLNPQATGLTGNGGVHNNMQPFLALFFIIAMQGVFPPRS
jgi:microcystin-dependent protein